MWKDNFAGCKKAIWILMREKVQSDDKILQTFHYAAVTAGVATTQGNDY